MVTKLLPTTAANPIPPNCQHRDDAFLVQKLKSHEYGSGENMPHHSFFSSPTGALFIESSLSRTGSLISGTISGDRGSNPGTCAPVPGSSHIYESSICSWHYRINHDTDRYPQSITEAFRDISTGVCKQCFLSQSERVPLGSATCKEIVYNVPVLRRNANTCDGDGYYLYEESWQKVTVGYTCARVLEA